jgi:hypothetical protein
MRLYTSEKLSVWSFLIRSAYQLGADYAKYESLLHSRLSNISIRTDALIGDTHYIILSIMAGERLWYLC